jgi:hypothetical protein
MDDWAWEHLAPWQCARRELPIGPLFCDQRADGGKGLDLSRCTVEHA